MALFLDSLAFSADPQEISTAGRPVAIRLKPFQVLIWVSLTYRGVEQLPSATPRIPALLDPGHNHTFALGEQYLEQSGLMPPYPWSGQPLRVRDASGVERVVQRLYVDVWIHANVPEFADRPYPLRLATRGAAYYPKSGPVSGPPLPLLGMAALCEGSLTLHLRCHPAGGTVQIFVPDAAQT